MTDNDTVDDSSITDWNEFLKKSKVYCDHHWSLKTPPTVGLNDFEVLRTLGRGSFGTVILMKHVKSGKYYATKVLNKFKIIMTSHIHHALNEKRVLQSVRMPFAIHLEYFFQDNSNLYFVLPFVGGGELFTHLRRLGRFDEVQTKFYSAQVLLGLEYLHYLDILYRDLKPENILVETNGFAKLADFGFCKVVKGRTYTLCGTPEYIAPEVVLSKGYGKSADYWSFGVLMYELAAGYPPFHSFDTMTIFEKATQAKYKTVGHFSSDLKDIIKNLLQPDITKRLGVIRRGVAEIKGHKYFSDIPWLPLLNKKINSPYTPRHSGSGDTRYFESMDDESLTISPHEKFPVEFKDF